MLSDQREASLEVLRGSDLEVLRAVPVQFQCSYSMPLSAARRSSSVHWRPPSKSASLEFIFINIYGLKLSHLTELNVAAANISACYTSRGHTRIFWWHSGLNLGDLKAESLGRVVCGVRGPIVHWERINQTELNKRKATHSDDGKATNNVLQLNKDACSKLLPVFGREPLGKLLATVS